MRILQVIEPSGGGSGRQVVDLTQALIDAGHQVALAYSPLRAEPRFEAEVAALPLTALERLPLRRAVGPWDIPALRALNRLIARRGPFEILHGHSAKAGALIRLARAPGAAKIYTPHALPMMDAGGLSRVAAGVAECVLAHATTDAVIAVSTEEAAVARRWGLPRDRLHVAPNGLAAPPQPDRAAARRLMGVSDDTVVVGFVGRLCRQKDPLRFARAVRMARRAAPRLVGVMIGQGDLAAATANEGGDAVRLLGAADARGLMAGFDLFALTSRYEADAYALIEAAALGLPIVATEVGGTSRLIASGARIDRLPTDAPAEDIAQSILSALSRPPGLRPAALPSAAQMAARTADIYRQAFQRRRLGG
ncbi:Putative glycosyltransferase EpsF [Brevundimonas sp. SH203]|uniref:glycosyltransferase family 4 protein n=1 Tax=Brevundimonas sp. SH203 TaxID=345167 RepID=UPI0009CCDF2B|nr:glycosyltransferase family 4 protein [Brevundimonas sp. SH203]GAW40328.1 Putative glycosyltransferase EpsF [Brevundimonas sp. SH203]